MIHPLTDEIQSRRNANDAAIRMAALEAASRIHQRVSLPTGATLDRIVLVSAAAYERYIRTGEYDAPR